MHTCVCFPHYYHKYKKISNTVCSKWISSWMCVAIWLQSKLINWINEIEIYTSLTTRLSGFYTLALLLFSLYSPDDKLTKFGIWVSLRCVFYTTRYKWRHLYEGTIEIQLHRLCDIVYNNFIRPFTVLEEQKCPTNGTTVNHKRKSKYKLVLISDR